MYYRLLPCRIFFILFFTFVAFSSRAQFSKLKPGFDAQECEDLLKINAIFQDTTRTASILQHTTGYTLLYRTPNVGLDNVADIWLRQDSVVVLAIRGTTTKMESFLEDFYCAMVPAAGTLQLTNEKAFDYKLAEDPKAAVHAGFLIGFGYLAGQLKPKFDELYAKGYRDFMISGHSQGGALCYYFSAWLMYKRKQGEFKGITVKTYASAPPKMGNMYFAYDYDNAHLSMWTFSIVNSADPVPEMPLTTQQLEIDMNEPNPILNLEARFNDLSWLKRWFVKKAFNKMKNSAQKSSEAYQKYLGKYVGDFIHKSLPELQLPNPVKTTYFVRPGVPIVLSANEAYKEKFKNAALYFDHGIDPYRYLLRQYYQGLEEFVPVLNIKKRID